MTTLQHTCTLHEKTVQKIAQDDIKIPRRTRRMTRKRNTNVKTRKRNTNVKTRHWYEGLDPLLIAYIKKHNLKSWDVKIISSSSFLDRRGYAEAR